MFQIAIKFINLFLFQGPPKFTQIGILGLKKYHLATVQLSNVCSIDCLQGDQIWRIFAQWAILYFGQFFIKYISSKEFWLLFSM
jgi:hypothetical protein